jgi:broad specificity phosphatase PhoE
LVRHCHPDYDKKEEVGDEKMPLSNIGKKQRTCLNKKILQVKPHKIYVSELTRARETAEEFSKMLGIKPKVEPRLNEVDWKDWYKMRYFNMTRSTRVRRTKNYRKMEAHLKDIQSRSRRLIAEMYRKHKGKGVVLVCHGNLIRSVLTSILNADVIGFLSFEIYQSSVSKIVIDKDGYVKINYINSIGHLPHRPDEDIFRIALNN